MKHIIRAVIITALFVIFVGSIGAYDQSHITLLQCLIQVGLCSLGTVLTLKGWCK